MKNMKMIVAAALLLCSVSGAMAQQKLQTQDSKTELRGQMKENMAKLNLTDEQKKPFGEINRKYALKIKDLRAQNLSQADKLKAMKDLRDQKNAEVKGILKDDQYQTYLQIQEERIQKVMERKKG